VLIWLAIDGKSSEDSNLDSPGIISHGHENKLPKCSSGNDPPSDGNCRLGADFAILKMSVALLELLGGVSLVPLVRVGLVTLLP
jgi:hypothetical protein